MAIQPDMIGITVSDIAVSLRFYRLLGLSIPEGADGEPHVEVITPNSYRIAWDTEELIKSLNPVWVQPLGQFIAMAFTKLIIPLVTTLHSGLLGKPLVVIPI